ncbi:Golgi apparatus membrane protein TVP23 [Vararia minispora EC-137]|uniref:Golgi apparatus membrane protein TVP23 n=1 Tax=Vararia minispora EC-137 TaxID=1314806 RepID=A0ACB8QYH1_9AGAM|nr:Golgi apparatus membrane protein TVP23 [Vararia minispora EC-137]
MASVATPLLETIEADEPPPKTQPATSAPLREAVVLTPGGGGGGSRRALDRIASTPNDTEAGLAGIFRQSAHPGALFFLYFFRTLALAAYILSGFFPDYYVISAVVIVVFLSMDFWNCRNVAGRTLVGLRFWNQVDEDGESSWVFESRDPSRPANPVDSRMFWTALYIFPAFWLILLIVSFLKLSISFIPIVILALVFNMTNVVGFTYADRDAKRRWATNAAASGWSMGVGGLGGQILSGVVKNSVGRVFR